MTTAHRPTFDPAKGKEAQRGPAYHQRLLPAHTQLKVRKPGQGGDADHQVRDLRAELLQAEAAHFAKIKGGPVPVEPEPATNTSKRQLENGDGEEEEDLEAKRRRILEETRDIDADSDDAGEDDSSEEDRFVSRKAVLGLGADLSTERERTAAEEAEREHDIALGNPLLNSKADFNVKRRWDDDVIFKNQARGTDDKGKKKEFVNDLLRSDFHKRFMSKYVR
ncbi:Cwf15/Cwc15 cell cycle control protein [Hyaloscypha bicolor E]|uniref:Cwf15/Cwc15 cell cycle control protein n=1 Tax=Hyaloscypha bicolor E TaxID=1095630 RepID=A0A2J6SWU5_9HELO|nr:Cwf15/Cwc15 cell cycle control protein [Hyaloscypha bicolor E]PMD55238.1 Cwf15/Cwc15 cell cycle control protein [Hyaloscypha bicolor E]